MTPRNRPNFKNAPYVQYWPRLTFYYGLSIEELATTPKWLLREYLEQLGELLAEQQLTLLTASAYPHMKQEAASKLWRSTCAIADGRDPNAKDEVAETPSFQTREGFAVALGGAGIGLVLENAEGEEVTPIA